MFRLRLAMPSGASHLIFRVTVETPSVAIAVISHTNRPSSPHSPAEYLPGGLASVMMPVPWVTTVTRIHNGGDVALDLFQEPG